MSRISPLTSRYFSRSIAAVLVVLLSSCAINQSHHRQVTTAKLQALDLNNLVKPAVNDQPVSMSAAKNEWASFQMQVSGLPDDGDRTFYTLRIQALNFRTTNKTIAAENFSVYQILPMPVDVNRAGYVRHTGLSTATGSLPRALLPMPVNDGRINLSAVRDPDHPTDMQSCAAANRSCSGSIFTFRPQHPQEVTPASAKFCRLAMKARSHRCP